VTQPPQRRQGRLRQFDLQLLSCATSAPQSRSTSSFWPVCAESVHVPGRGNEPSGSARDQPPPRAALAPHRPTGRSPPFDQPRAARSDRRPTRKRGSVPRSPWLRVPVRVVCRAHLQSKRRPHLYVGDLDWPDRNTLHVHALVPNRSSRSATSAKTKKWALVFVLGAWCLVLGAWFLVLGGWCEMAGTQHMPCPVRDAGSQTRLSALRSSALRYSGAGWFVPGGFLAGVRNSGRGTQDARDRVPPEGHAPSWPLSVRNSGFGIRNSGRGTGDGGNRGLSGTASENPVVGHCSSHAAIPLAGPGCLLVDSVWRQVGAAACRRWPAVGVCRPVADRRRHAAVGRCVLPLAAVTRRSCYWGRSSLGRSDGAELGWVVVSDPLARRTGFEDSQSALDQAGRSAGRLGRQTAVFDRASETLPGRARNQLVRRHRRAAFPVLHLARLDSASHFRWSAASHGRPGQPSPGRFVLGRGHEAVGNRSRPGLDQPWGHRGFEATAHASPEPPHYHYAGRSPRAATQNEARHCVPGVAHGRPIVPVLFCCDRAWRIQGSWTDLVVPKPFSTVVGLSEKPIWVPPGLSRQQIDQYCQVVQAAMDRLAGWAEQIEQGADPASVRRESRQRAAA